MPVRTGKTSYRHDDYRIQREFERKGNELIGLEKRLSTLESTPSVTQQIVKPEIVKKKVQSAIGVVYVNQLPFDPAGRNYTNHPSPDFDYIYNHFGYTPSSGYYGWYVYGIITHNLGLDNKDEYLINLIGLEDWGIYTNDVIGLGEDFTGSNIFDTDTQDRALDMDQDNDSDIDDIVTRILYFQDRQFYVHHEGLNSNQIIVHGIHKPDLAMYFGGPIPAKTPHFVGDPANRIVQSNIAFKYIIQKRIKEM